MTTRRVRAVLPRCLWAVAFCWGPALQAQDVAVDFQRDRGMLIGKATTLPRGQGYVAAMIPGIVGVAYGLDDRLTVQGGTIPWTLFGGVVVGFGSLRAAIVQTEAFHLAVGGFGVIAFDDDETEAAGWPYATVTVGPAAYSFTGLIGVGSSTDIFWSDFNGEVLLQGEGEALLARNLKAMVEVLYLGEDSEPLVGTGIRFFGDRGAVEVGVGWVPEESAVIPWAAVAYAF